MAQIFTCKLKEPRAGMPRGTTIQVASSFSSPAEYEIADECERRFGKLVVVASRAHATPVGGTCHLLGGEVERELHVFLQ